MSPTNESPRPRSNGPRSWLLGLSVLALAALSSVVVHNSSAIDLATGPATVNDLETVAEPVVTRSAEQLLAQGRAAFRHNRLGSHTWFSRTLKLHHAIQTLPPATALAVGLKVDSDALPASVITDIQQGNVDLNDPAVTQVLIGLRAVVGVNGKFSESGELFEVGITCALCHSTVDDSIAPGIGRRLDGWANRDLDVGTIVSLAPRLGVLANLLGVDVETARAVLLSWGPGKFDAHINLDGKAFRPDGGSGAVLIPPAFGLAGVNLATYTGWGSVPYWNAFVGNLEMSGTGTFYDPRLQDAERFPIAAREGFGNVRDNPDLITRRLAGLHFYQLSLPAPPAPEGSYDVAAATRGEALFVGRAQCASCHVPPLYTDPGWNLHSPEEIGIDDFQAQRSPTGAYRTTPLKGLWTHTKGGFYHDGRFATLGEVIDHYDNHFDLQLAAGEKQDLAEFLMSL